MKLTQKRLKELVVYDPETGVFVNLVDRCSTARKGGIIGSHGKDGYLRANIGGSQHKLHRLAFLYMEGYIPEYQVDHKNGIRTDNRWINLRHVSRLCNMQNQKKRNNNKSGFSGVYWDKYGKKWCAQSVVNNKHISIGCYTNKLDAALSRLTWEIQCPQWTCNHRGVLIQQIKAAWPEFNPRSLD